MLVCAACQSHRRPGEGPCPWCGQPPRFVAPLRTAAALLLGLGVVGCPEPQPKYGVTITDSAEDTDTDAVEDTDSP